MKKIVSNIMVVGSQLLIGGLFLVVLFSGKTEDNMVVVVKNNNMNKMSDVVTTLFLENKVTDYNSDVVEDLKDENDPVVTDVPEEKEVPIAEEPKVENVPPVVENSNSNQNSNVVDTSGQSVIDTYYGALTGYGPDCNGCSGFTSSGHNANASITYDDYQYGTVRIVAADPSIPLYSIIRITMSGADPFLAIVLDRGGQVGFGRATLFDLLFATESQAMGKTKDVTFERLR